MIEGSEKYRILNVGTGDEIFTDNKSEAYCYAGLFISRGFQVKLEEREETGAVVWSRDSYALVA